MTNLTEKQRAALTALRDVMKEHDIAFFGMCHDPVIGSYSAGFWIDEDGFQPELEPLDFTVIAKLLEQETE